MGMLDSVCNQFGKWVTSGAVRVLDPGSGQTVQEQGNSPVSAYFPTLTAKQIAEHMHHCLTAGTPQIYLIHAETRLLLLMEVSYTTSNGSQLLQALVDGTDTVFWDTPEADAGVCVLSEWNRLRRQTITDDLTGLYNRRYIDDRLPVDIQNCVKQQKPLSIVFADLDYYKRINDIYGHAAGDAVLNELAGILLSHIRKGNDWVARYGGEEFLILLNECENERAKNSAEALRVAVMKHIFMYHNSEIHITCSFGVITIDDFSVPHPVDKVLDTVDKRLYQAKQLGRNVVI